MLYITCLEIIVKQLHILFVKFASSLNKMILLKYKYEQMIYTLTGSSVALLIARGLEQPLLPPVKIIER